jgi:hypothetical protein
VPDWCSVSHLIRPRRVFCAVLMLAPLFAFAQTSVLTWHNDNTRTGQNLTETRLTPANVNSSSFGKLFNLMVDGKVDAQPLYVSGLQMPGAGVRNIVFVETEHGSAYAFDSDTGANLWQMSTLKSGETTSDPQNCSQIVPEIGITATPVIDLKAGPHGTIYIVAMSKDGAGNYYQRLHALDLTNGAEQFGGPIDIHATYPGTGDTSVNGSVVFDPRLHEERAGLLLVNGVVYTSWTSHCDIRPYNGWTIGYDELTLTQASVFNFAPNGNDASIWNAGAGPAADAAGTLFFAVSNGTFDTALDTQGFPSRGDYGNAFIRLQPSGSGLHVLDYWTMYNTVSESDRDLDLGSGGVLLLPDVQDSIGQVRHLGVGAGKDSTIYVFDRDNMGKFNPIDNSNLYQELAGVLQGNEFGAPAWFNGTLYFGAVNDNLKALPVTAARVSTTPSSVTANQFTYPGSTPSISANGISNAIVWAAENSNPAVLHAYDATNLNRELYNSNQAPNGRDQFGAGNKFITPVIADGKVFVGSQNSVAVFGLLQAPPPPRAATTVTISPSATTVTAGTPITFNVTVTSAAGFMSPGGEAVTVMDGSTPLASGVLTPQGNTTISTAALSVGPHSVTAAYPGDSDYLPGASAAVQIVVTPAPSVAQGTLSISPNPIFAPLGTIGPATLTWTVAAGAAVELRVGAPNGPLFAVGNSQGSATTGPWVTNGMTFYLEDVTQGEVLTPSYTIAKATAVVQLQPESGSLVAAPNPVPVPAGQASGSATFNWNTSTATTVELHVGAPDGPLFALGGPQGTAVTGGWVTDGLTFFLQDVSLGQPLTPQFTIATQTVRFSPNANSISFQASPNPVLVSPGTGLGTSTVFWNAPGALVVEVHVGAPDGPLFAQGGPQGSAAATGWVSEGTIFYLQDVSGGKSLTGANTLATVTAHLIVTGSR